MTESVIFQLAQEAFTHAFRPRVPHRSGNMRRDASKVVQVDENTANIIVDAEIAPYVVYTNEPWISPYWKGRKNPNQWWFEKATEAVARYIASRLGGTLTVGTDMEETKEQQTIEYRTRRAAVDDVYNDYYGGKYRGITQ